METAVELMRVIQQQRKRIAVLERALAPFAREANEWLDTVSPGYRPGLTEPRHTQAYSKAAFTMRDLRRARRLLAGSVL